MYFKWLKTYGVSGGVGGNGCVDNGWGSDGMRISVGDGCGNSSDHSWSSVGVGISVGVTGGNWCGNSSDNWSLYIKKI